MNILPGEGYSIPEEASLQGWALVNKRAANMVFTVYGEKPMTKLLQIGGSPAFVDSLGSVSYYGDIPLSIISLSYFLLVFCACLSAHGLIVDQIRHFCLHGLNGRGRFPQVSLLVASVWTGAVVLYGRL